MFIRINDQFNNVWLNLMQVTFVTERKSEFSGCSVEARIHFQGGDCLALYGWSVKQWEEMLAKVQRQSSLLMGKGGHS